MVGVLITGHGNFATGLKTSVELIAGASDYFAIFGSYDCSNKLICYPYFFTLNQHKLSSLLV